VLIVGVPKGLRIRNVQCERGRLRLPRVRIVQRVLYAEAVKKVMGQRGGILRGFVSSRSIPIWRDKASDIYSVAMFAVFPLNWATLKKLRVKMYWFADICTAAATASHIYIYIYPPL
jgi:hypothetical protein